MVDETATATGPESRRFWIQCAVCGYRTWYSRWQQGFYEIERYRVDVTHSCEAWRRQRERDG